MCLLCAGFCWTATMAIWMPFYFVITIYILGHVQDAIEGKDSLIWKNNHLTLIW